MSDRITLPENQQNNPILSHVGTIRLWVEDSGYSTTSNDSNISPSL